MIDIINVGNIANDGTGDDLREAFIKVNDNFDFVFTRLGESTAGENIGLTGEDVFIGLDGTTLQFRKINGDDAIKIVVGADDSLQAQFAPTADVDFNGQGITNADVITANEFVGDFTGELTGSVVGTVRSAGNIADFPPVDVSLLNRQVNTFDYGIVAPVFTNPIAYLLQEIGTDLGTFTSPNPVSIDAGTIL
jgi:hypothetical protein